MTGAQALLELIRRHLDGEVRKGKGQLLDTPLVKGSGRVMRPGRGR